MKTENYNIFWQRLHKNARDKGFPLRVMFELTYRCNFKCRHCYVPFSYRKRRELKTQEVFSILDQLKDIGCMYLGFTGGEPLMRKDALDIFKYAKKCGFEVIIYTNGSLIDARIAGELAALRLNKVDITIPAMSQGAFERITQASGSHKKVFKAIELLRKQGVSLGFKTCVLKDSEDEIKQIQDFSASLGALHRLDGTLSLRLDGSDEPYAYRGRLSLGKSNLEIQSSKCHCDRERSVVGSNPVTERLPRSSQPSGLPRHCVPRNDIDLNGIDLFKCGVGKSQAAITPLGEFKMCLMINHLRYKILTRNDGVRFGLKVAWDKLKESVEAIKPDRNYKCAKCGLQLHCKWCPARGWLAKRNFTSCDPESRKAARRIAYSY